MFCFSGTNHIHRKSPIGNHDTIFGRQCHRWNTRRPIRQENTNTVASSFSWNIDHMGRFSISMVNSLPFMLLISIVLGFLSGIGVGGGSLLMLWLTLILNMPHTTARTINMLFFIPSAVIASLFRWQQGRLNLKNLIPAIIGGCISAAIFSIISRNLDMDVLKKLFGILLLITGLKELFYRQRKPK